MENFNSLKVELGKRSYNILIGNGLIGQAGTHVAKVIPAKKVFIVTDDNVAPLYLKKLENSLDAEGIKHSHCILPHGEKSKSFVSLEGLLDKIFAQNPDRRTTLIALGGGVIGDLTGFAASIVLRGINFIQIPTTLLAQVDSSVGGKTGINNSFGKNLVGSFYQPLLVLADIDVIKTLPKREFLSGYAEVVKYGLINDVGFFNWLDENSEKILKYDNDSLQYIVRASCAAKAKIVVEDEHEGGVRALLNLGHTFGHALEKETGYSDKLLHGEAVAIGTIFAFKLSYKLGLCKKEDVIAVENHFKKIGLRTSPLEVQKVWDKEKLLGAMRQDKKAYDGKMTFILTDRVGSSFINKDVAENAVMDVIEEVVVANV